MRDSIQLQKRTVWVEGVLENGRKQTGCQKAVRQVAMSRVNGWVAIQYMAMWSDLKQAWVTDLQKAWVSNLWQAWVPNQ